jgi:hypothetical protein
MGTRTKAVGIIMAAMLVLVGCGFGGNSVNNTPGPPSPNTITVVQAAGADTAANPPVTSPGSSAACPTQGTFPNVYCNNGFITLPNPVQNGDLIVVMLTWNQDVQQGLGTVTVTDSQNNIYTNVSTASTPTTLCGNNISTNDVCYAFYAKNVSGGSNFKINLSLANKGQGGSFFEIGVLEAKNASTLDFWQQGQCGTNVTGCTAYATGPFQETHADALLVGFAEIQPSTCNGCGPSFAVQAGPSFTLDWGPAGTYHAFEHLVTTTPGQYNGIFSSNLSGWGSTFFTVLY